MQNFIRFADRLQFITLLGNAILMEQIWYIIVDGSTQGPFSILELKRKPLITPDTLCWKEGFADWTPMRDVKELDEVFKDEGQPPLNEETEPKKVAFGDMAIAVKKEPNFTFIWFIIALLIFLYLLTQILR